MFLKIAEFIIDFQKKYKGLDAVLSKYETDPVENPDYVLSYTEEEIAEFNENYNGVSFFSRAEMLLMLSEMAKTIMFGDCFLLHSALIDVEGTGVAFAAPSGTGKTTQMLNWQKLLGDKVTIVNGDKPLVRFFDKPNGDYEQGIPYGFGCPWCGKERLETNMRTKIKHICFVQRSETNYVTKLDEKSAVNWIMQQIYLPKNDPAALLKTLELANRFINACDLWVIHCNKEPDSASVAYKAIFENKQ